MVQIPRTPVRGSGQYLIIGGKNFIMIWVYYYVGVFDTGGHVVCGLHLCRDDATEAALSGKRGDRPTQSDLQGKHIKFHSNIVVYNI